MAPRLATAVALSSVLLVVGGCGDGEPGREASGWLLGLLPWIVLLGVYFWF